MKLDEYIEDVVKNDAICMDISIELVSKSLEDEVKKSKLLLLMTRIEFLKERCKQLFENMN